MTDRLAALLADPLQSFDARDWAKAFVKIARKHPSIAESEGAMLAWFANALMRGFDEHARRTDSALDRSAPETPEAVREDVAKAFVVALHGGDAWEQWTLPEREAWLGVIDAIAPILRAADQREIARLTAELFQETQGRELLAEAQAEIARWIGSNDASLRLIETLTAENARLTAALATAREHIEEINGIYDANCAHLTLERDNVVTNAKEIVNALTDRLTKVEGAGRAMLKVVRETQAASTAAMKAMNLPFRVVDPEVDAFAAILSLEAPRE